jgi:hypothetical protein
MPDFSGAPPKQLDECGFHAEQRRKLESAPSSTETSEERRLRHRLEKIDKALDELGAPKHEQVDGLTMELSRVGRIKRLALPSAIAPRITDDMLDAALAHFHGPAWKKVYSLTTEHAMRADLRRVLEAATERGAE